MLARARLGKLMPNAVQTELVQDLAQVGIDEENLDAELLALNGCQVTAKNFWTFVQIQRNLLQAGKGNREEEKGPARLSR